MEKDTIHLPQGSVLRLFPGEKELLAILFRNQGINIDCIDFKQDVVVFPQPYVGYINLPERRVIIDPKHDGVDLRHIIRIYYFLYSNGNSDLDDPIYDLDRDRSFDVIKKYIEALDTVIKKGLPVEYKVRQDTLQHLRGNINVVNTLVNKKLGRIEVFDCLHDELSKDIPINQILLKALKKAEIMVEIGRAGYFKSFFGDVSEPFGLPGVSLNTNTAYCKKALTLAYMILNDLNISDYGSKGYGQNLLINFDRLFEEFIKRILTEYSGDFNYTYWDEEKTYAVCKASTGVYFKSYIPDMLYRFQDNTYPTSAFGILDMKNKISRPFNNADVYQMLFYANQLYSKKVILCYPSSVPTEVAVLKFDNDSFSLKRIYATFLNITGDSSVEFKNNINTFIEEVKSLL